MTPPEAKKFRSYVPDKTEMREFTVRAVLLGLAMTVVLGAANLYLGLRAGMTDRKSTRLNSSHLGISYAVFCLRKESCGVGGCVCHLSDVWCARGGGVLAGL